MNSNIDLLTVLRIAEEKRGDAQNIGINIIYGFKLVAERLHIHGDGELSKCKNELPDNTEDDARD